MKRFARGTLLLELEKVAAEEPSKIMGALLRLGGAINALDVLIRGIAVANHAQQVVTADRDFEAVGRVAEISIQAI